MVCGSVWAATLHLWSMELSTDKDLPPVLNVWIAGKLIEKVGFTYFSRFGETAPVSMWFEIAANFSRLKWWKCDIVIGAKPSQTRRTHVLIIWGLALQPGLTKRMLTFKWSNKVGWDGRRMIAFSRCSVCRIEMNQREFNLQKRGCQGNAAFRLARQRRVEIMDSREYLDTNSVKSVYSQSWITCWVLLY